MSKNSDPSSTPVPPSSVQLAPAYLGRKLWVPVVFVILYWIAFGLIGQLDLPMFTRFLGRAGALLVMLVAFSSWWFVRAPVRLSYRFLVLGWAIGCAVVVTLLLHRSVLAPSVHLLALPAVFTAWTIWLVLSRSLTEKARVVGMLVLPILIWSPGLLVRMEGLKGDGAADFRWRWDSTAEEQFLNLAVSVRNTDNLPGYPLTAGAEDWTEFRGPRRDATVHGLKIATDWDRNPPQQVWRTRVGPAWSSMVIVGGLLFTQEQRGEKEIISCFDANTGKPRWVHEDQGRFEENLGGVGPRGTPTFANGRIYALGAAGRLNCLDARSGKKIWTRDIVADASARNPTWGFSGSPLIVNQRVIVFAGGENNQALLGYDELTGEKIWTQNAGIESYSSPQLVSIAEQSQILFVGDKQVTAHEPESGKVIWTYQPTLSFGRPVVQPRLIGDSQLLVSFVPDEGVARIEVRRNGEQWDVSETWNSRDIKPDFSDFVHHDGHIYGFDGNIFCCVDLATGKRKWKGGRYGAGQVLLLADQPLLLVITEQGELVLVAVNADKHVELARIEAIQGKTWNHPAISGRRLFVRNAEEMACFELKPMANETAVALGRDEVAHFKPRVFLPDARLLQALVLTANL